MSGMRIAIMGRRIQWRILILGWLTLFLAALPPISHASPFIFVLHAYSQEYPWTKGQHEGFVGTLERLGVSPVISTEYLDSKRRRVTETFASSFAEYLKFKYSGLVPQAIYVTDDASLEFALAHLTRIFPGVPVFFSGVNNLAMLTRIDPSLVTGVIEKKEIGPNLRLLLDMGQDLSQIAIVGDNTSTFQAIRLELEKELQAYPDIQARFIANEHLGGLLEALRHTSARFVFLTTIGGVTDDRGKTLRPAEVIDAINKSGIYALISMEDAYLQQGVLGGYVTKGELQGATAASMVQRYLAGTPIQRIPPIQTSPNGYVFDERELKIHQLTLPDAIAKQATILHPSPGRYQAYRHLILGSLYLLGGLLIITLVGFVIVLSRKNWTIRHASAYLASQQDLLARVQDSLVLAQQIARLGNWDWNLTDRSMYWSEGLYTLFGVDKHAFHPSYEDFLSRIHPEDRNLVDERIEASLKTGHPHEIEHRILLPDGQERVVREQAKVILDDQGNPVRMIGTIQDITESSMARQALLYSEQQLRHIAQHDALTGMPNRLMFNEQLEHAIEKANRHQEKLAVLFLDLDRFKQINDSLGHAQGDELLKDVAQRIARSLRTADLSARLGGDEFVVLLDPIEHPSDAAHVAQKLIDAMLQPIHLQGQMIFTSLSIGIAIYPEDGTDAVTLLRNADSAMYRSKEEGRNTFHFYDQTMTEAALAKLSIEQGLRTALQEGQFELYYQPQIGLRQGELSAMEALLRWQRPGTPIGPDVFVPIAEDTGLIIPIGQWVLQEACMTMKRWLDQGLVTPAATMCVNVSRKQLKYATFVELVTRILSDTGLSAHHLELEITEGTIMEDPLLATQTLERLRALGISIAIDDFGTGYSSLSHLKTLPITTLKIDRSFVMDIPDDKDDVSIAQAVMAMAHQLGLEVVAEGIETAAQADFLRELGCAYGQGYFYARPMPGNQMAAWAGAHQAA